jgi:hypothetical protein
VAQHRFHQAFNTLHRHGTAHALHDWILKAANSVVMLKILRGVWTERVDPSFVQCPETYTHGFLPAAVVREFARVPENGLSESFVEEALSKGDACYGICDGGTLASYGWYSTAPTRIDPPDLFLRFCRDYVYMYKGFTHLRYRGQRLHGIGMTLALRHYLAAGYKGLVSYIESNNFDSLKSSFRMGYSEFGSVYVLKLFGRCFSWRSRGCKHFEFGIETLQELGAHPMSPPSTIPD